MTSSQCHTALLTKHQRSFCQQTSKPIFSLHSLQLSCYVHPYLIYCFAGESTMHHVQTLLKSCFPGSKHWQAAKKAALKKGMCLVDKTEFELGTNTAQHYLRKNCTSEGYNKITPNKFLIVPMQKKQGVIKQYFLQTWST